MQQTTYAHPLTFEERERIEFRLRCKVGIRAIARALNRNHSVISREVNANGGKEKYRAASARQRAEYARRKRGRHRILEKNEVLREHVIDQLNAGWAPHVIAGRLKELPFSKDDPLYDMSVSHETIYQYIYTGEGRHRGLYHCLPYKHHQRKKQGQRTKRTPALPDRISIHARPKEINERTTFGHWESDSVIYSKQPFTLSVQSERVSKLLRMHKTNNKTAEETEIALRKTIDSLPQEAFKSFTFDNGSENMRHTVIRDEFLIGTYFCDTYSSWQKGGVEQTNSIIRRYIPHKKDLSSLTDREIYEIQETINNTPRKSLNYRTPNEVAVQYLKEVVR